MPIRSAISRLSRQPSLARSLLAGAAVFLAVAGPTTGASAQSGRPSAVAARTPQQVLAKIATAWQTGATTRRLLTPEMTALVKQQTQGTGIYKELQILGPVEQVLVTSEQALPRGMLYAMRTQHKNGYSDWLVGRQADGRIAYITLQVSADPAPAPAPNPACYFVGKQLC